jgi:hypothetical protein
MATPKKKIEPAAARSAVAAVPPAPAPKRAEPAYAAKRAEPTYEQIAQRAKQIWESSGRQPGRDEENWLRAETELRTGR